MTNAATGSDTGPAGEDAVLVRVAGSTGHLTLNRPRQLNALDHAMVHTIQAALDGWRDDPAVAVILLDGAGERGLCAGGDIKAIYHDATSGGDASIDYWRDEYRLNVTIAEYPKPFVAIMDGIVMGGGVGLSGHASHRIVTDRSRVGMPEVGIGLIPDVGGTYLLAGAGPLGDHIAATRATLSAADALHTGFADHYIAADDLTAFTESLTRDGLDQALAEHIRIAPPSQLAANTAWITDCYAGSDPRQVLTRLRDAPYGAAAEAAAAFDTASPTALTVALAAIRQVRSGRKTLRQAINAEFAIVSNLLHHPDLAEGIRAQIIDKDRNPRWNPATLDAVGELGPFFEPAGDPPFPDDTAVPTPGR